MTNEKRLIDANALLNTVSVVTDDITCPLHIAASIDQVIELAPTVDAVEVVHGYWEKEYDDLDIDRGWKCSHCKGSVYQMTYESYQYCPHCGANMDGEGREGE